MAKYAKKRSKRKAHRRRRVGALALSPSSALVKYGSVALGYFMGDKVNAQVDKLTGGKVDGKIVGAAEAGLGFLLAFKGKSSMIKTVAGGVLLGAGAKKLLSEFGVISGIGGYGRVPVVGGYGRVPVIGGYTPNQMLAGALNGSNSGYPVPRPVHKQVMGTTSGDGSGSGLNADNRN